MHRARLILIGGLLIAAAVVGLDALFAVHQTQQALVMQFGRPVRVERDPGLKVKLPLIQNVQYFDRRILDLDPSPQEVILADQKRINVDSYVRYRIVEPLRFKQRAVSQAAFESLFGGRLNAAVRAEVGQRLLGDMLSEQRDNIMARIDGYLKEQAKDFGVEVVDVRIIRTDLPPATSQAVYSRMNSEREAQARLLRAEGSEIKARIQAEADRDRTVILAEAKRQAQILRGEGEGKKTEILNAAFGEDPEFFAFYRTMEAYGEALGDGTTMVLSPTSDFFKYFNDIGGRSAGSAKPAPAVTE